MVGPNRLDTTRKSRLWRWNFNEKILEFSIGPFKIAVGDVQNDFRARRGNYCQNGGLCKQIAGDTDAGRWKKGFEKRPRLRGEENQGVNACVVLFITVVLNWNLVNDLRIYFIICVLLLLISVLLCFSK